MRKSIRCADTDQHRLRLAGMTITDASPSALDIPYALSDAAIAAYRRDGHVRLSQVLDPATIATYGDELTRLVTDASHHFPPLHQRDTYGKAFLQVGNLWERSAIARTFVFGQRIARIATALMGTRGVRIYHDQALDKEPGGGFTPWHCDQQYWPFASPHCVTAWIPLQAVPMEMGPLAFASGSQHLVTGRDLEISDDSERVLARTLRDCPHVVEPFALGDVSFHAGWTFHRAGPNTTERFRRVMTIIYMDVDMRAAEPTNPRQANDLREWMPGIAPNGICESPRNPVMYIRNSNRTSD